MGNSVNRRWLFGMWLAAACIACGDDDGPGDVQQQGDGDGDAAGGGDGDGGAVGNGDGDGDAAGDGDGDAAGDGDGDAAGDGDGDGDTASTGSQSDGGIMNGDPVSFEDVDPSKPASDLTAAEMAAACREMDRVAGLLGDVETGCQAEAWAVSLNGPECEENLEICNDAGDTELGFELPLGCAQVAETMPDCQAVVEDMIDCAEAQGEFFRTRTCEEAHIDDPFPDCVDELAEVCPEFYGMDETDDAADE